MSNIKDSAINKFRFRPYLKVFNVFVVNYGIQKAILLSAFISMDSKERNESVYKGTDYDNWFKYYESDITKDTNFEPDKIEFIKDDLIEEELLFSKTKENQDNNDEIGTVYQINYKKLGTDIRLVTSPRFSHSFCYLDKEILHIFGETKAMIIAFLSDEFPSNPRYAPWQHIEYEYTALLLNVSDEQINETIKQLEEMGLIQTSQKIFKGYYWFKYTNLDKYTKILEDHLYKIRQAG